MPLPGDADNIRRDDDVFAAAWNGILAWNHTAHGGIANVRTFGARGDGTDDTAAIRAAIAALTSGGKLVFPPGSYVLSGEVAGRSHIELVGYGATISSATRIRSYFYFGACTDVVVRGLTFDCGQPVLPTYVNNTVRGANGGSISYTADPGGVRATAAHGVKEVNSVCNDLQIIGNVFDLDRSGAIPIILSFVTDHSYAGTIGAIEVSNNTARMAGAAAAQFFAYRGIAGQGRLTLRGNTPDTYTYAFDIANVAELILEGNKIRNIAAANFLITGGKIGSRLIRSNTLENPGASAIAVQPPE